MIELINGVWVAIEGGDGCGKSSQTKKVTQYFSEQGYHVIETREPGGNPHSETLRKSIFDPEIANDPITQLFEFVAARRRTILTTIEPGIESGALIIADRSEGSTFAYQHFQGGLNWEIVKKINDIGTEGRRPDLTIYLDVDVDAGIERVKKAKGIDANYFDNVDRQSLIARRAGYKKLTKEWSARGLNPWVLVDSNQPLEKVTDDIIKVIAESQLLIVKK